MSRRREGRRSQNSPPQADALRFVLVWTPLIRKILGNVSVPHADIDDACQEVLVLAWKAAKDRRLDASHPPAVRAWVRIVATRLGARWAIRRKRTVLRDFDLAENDGDAEEPHLARDLLQELRTATTPQNWRAWLMRAQGYSLEEIAAAEGIPAATAHTRIRLAGRDFQAALNRERAREQTPVQRAPPRAARLKHNRGCQCWRCEELRDGPDVLAPFRARSADPLTCPHPEDDKGPISGDEWLCGHCGDLVPAPR